MADIKYYVYVDKRVRTGKVFYVGKGKLIRVREALRTNKHWMRIVLKDKGYIREVVFITEFEVIALAEEIRLIALYGRKNLANATDGGEGQSGAIISKETRLKMSKAGKGKKKPISRIEYLKTRVYSEATRKKIGDANRKRKYFPETILKMRNAKLGKKMSEESRRKVSLSLLGNQRARKGGKNGLH